MSIQRIAIPVIIYMSLDPWERLHASGADFRSCIYIVEGKIDLVGFVQFSSQDTLNKLPQQTRTELDSLPERLGVCLSNE